MAGLRRYNATTGRNESVSTAFKPLYIRRSLRGGNYIMGDNVSSIIGFDSTDEGAQTFSGEIYTALSQVYIPYDGVYHINASLCWDNASLVGRRAVQININGLVASADVDAANLPGNNAVTIAGSYWITGGTYIYIAGLQNSGANLNVIGDPQRSFMTVVRLS